MSIENKIRLKPDEEILSIIRRYGLTYFWSWILIIILLIVPFFFMFWLFNQAMWGTIIFFVLIFFALFFLFRTVFLWRNNVLIITTHRIIDYDQKGFFEKIISDVPYDQVEDVSGRIRGVFGTVFRYGNVNIQTGRGKVRIVIDRVKQPVFVQQEINEIREKFLSVGREIEDDELFSFIIKKLPELDYEEIGKIYKKARFLKRQIESVQDDLEEA